ncbi:N-acetylmuramoyl-L-alanine amidase [Flexistipes sp.]|uniref:N-acetylmuramoyl-L-alanine amidase n=1 Tax=Flexistipes sp. TaxID=3088135 RepID=UPI002E228DB6|nr:N-acetylmuramoyl-L-alanine amidase [Flexistipes sp.]
MWYSRTKALFLITVFILSLAAQSAASLKSEYFAAKDELAALEKSKNVSHSAYDRVANKFYSIYSRDPKYWLADDSLYLCGKTYLKSYWRFDKKYDLKNALKYYRLLGANYDSKWAADSYLKSAYIYSELNDYISAKYMLRRAIEKFPGSYSAEEAERRLDEIEKKLGNDNEINVNFTQNNPKEEAFDNVVNGSKNTGNDDAESVNSTVGSGDILIEDIRHFSSKEYTRVVLDLSEKAEFEKHWLKADPSHDKPPRLFLDIYDTRVNSNIQEKIKIKDGLLKAIRWGIFRKGVTRVVLDSQNVEDFTVFSLSNPSRIVIDVSDGTLVNKKAENNWNVPDDPSTDTLAGVFGLKVKTIVIDPGHGGKDPGAVYDGLLEKNIVLDIGKYLRNYIRENTDLKVFMTRETDRFIPLEERTAFANRKKADIFVSIHVNAARNRRARGVETYVLNVTNDEEALKVAALENKATEKSLSDLQGILKDIMLNSKLEESLMLAQFVQDDVVAQIKKKSLGVKQAPFYVLVGAKMPSILVECGFLSNSTFANKIRSSDYRRDIARGIYKGIIGYIEKYNGKG